MISLRNFSLLVILSIATSLAAQTTGTVAGTVAQPDGSPLPGATVEAKSPAVQGSRVATTDANGFYRLPLLPPGEYTLTFTMEGFAPAARRNIAVALGREATIDVAMRLSQSAEITVSAQERVDLHDIHLSVGDVTSTIEVQAQAVHVATDSSDRSSAWPQSSSSTRRPIPAIAAVRDISSSRLRIRGGLIREGTSTAGRPSPP